MRTMEKTCFVRRWRMCWGDDVGVGPLVAENEQVSSQRMVSVQWQFTPCRYRHRRRFEHLLLLTQVLKPGLQVFSESNAIVNSKRSILFMSVCGEMYAHLRSILAPNKPMDEQEISNPWRSTLTPSFRRSTTSIWTRYKIHKYVNAQVIHQ